MSDQTTNPIKFQENEYPDCYVAPSTVGVGVPRDVAVISLDERKFWHVDFYQGAADWGYWDWGCSPSPDGFATTKKDATEADARTLAAKCFPGAEIRLADDEQGDDEDIRE